MPYKRRKSPYYYIRRRTLPGYGDTGRISSGVTSKKVAGDMERALEEIAAKALGDPSWYQVLDAVCKSHTLPPADMLAARNRGELHALKKRLNDPTLEKAFQAYLAPGGRDRNVEIGLGQVLEAAPQGTRLSIFRDGAYITQFLTGLENENRKRNTVVRQAKRGISLLLRYHLGNAERNRIFADVDYSAEDDTREGHLTPEDIKRLLDACEEKGYRELAVLILLSMQTSADRGVMLSGKVPHKKKPLRGMLSKDVEIYKNNENGTYQGHVYLNDGKTQDRSRTQPITDRLCRELLVCLKGKKPDQAVLDMQYMDLDFYWQEVRKKAKLEHVRFKDLRAQYAIYAQKAGIPQIVVSKSMGHSSQAMTARYQQYAAVLTPQQANAIERELLRATA